MTHHLSFYQSLLLFNPNRSLDFGHFAPLCLADCFSACRRRSGLRQGKPGSKMLAEGGKMPEELSFRKKEPLSGLMTDLGLIVQRNQVFLKSGRFDIFEFG